MVFKEESISSLMYINLLLCDRHLMISAVTSQAQVGFVHKEAVLSLRQAKRRIVKVRKFPAFKLFVAIMHAYQPHYSLKYSLSQ